MNLQNSRRVQLRQARERYEHPLEVEAYSAQVGLGLTAEESAILSQYVPSPCRVLDLGCGAGREAIALAQQGYRIVATDISRAMLRAGRRFATQYEVSIAYVWMPDPLRLPVPHQAFDCALGFAQLLSHIPGSANRVAFLQEVQRVLVPGALFIGTVTDREAAADLLVDDEGEGGGSQPIAPEEGNWAKGGKESGDSLNEANGFSRDNHNQVEPSPLLKAAGWEEGDLLVWQPSEAKLDTPLFFHLHTEDQIRAELAAAGLVMMACIPGNELVSSEDHESGRYRFIVAKKV